MSATHIRNFCIIAHIDHGKSTLADRILEYTGAVSARDMTAQVLDKMDLERERGITIKAQAVRLSYTADDGQEYILNLIDTPGHVDFTYEVSRSLAACEGALLIVDATQGVEAQTLANLYLALESNLEIVPVINKIDLPSAEPERIRKEIEEVIGIDGDEAILASAKTGLGTRDILEAVVTRMPPPKGEADARLKALVFDSHFDAYKGVIAYVRVMEGTIKPGQRIRMMATEKEHDIVEVGVFRPSMETAASLSAGEVGYITGSIKNLQDCRVGDTMTDAADPIEEPLPGYRKVTPMVFSGLYPVDNADYDALKDALEKLQLNDASLVYEPESSLALGFGFRCGFLGLLHMEIIYERLQREYSIDIIGTFPSVEYHVKKTDGEVLIIENPAKLPLPTEIESVEEPFVKAAILVPSDYVGAVMELCIDKRGIFQKMEYPSPNRVSLHYELPLGEILIDFFDKLKSKTKGYASLDYEYSVHRPSVMVKLDIMLNGKSVDALSSIVHTDKAYSRGRTVVSKLKDIIPRHQFEVPIQATVGNKVIARETVRAVRKDVTAKCYGGDISRKRKLLEKQKEGKKKMKSFGQVELPQEAFLAVLRIDDDD